MQNYMKAVGVLEVIYQEVTADMVASWLEENKPVFLMTGRQLNLEKSGLNHYIGNLRFLKKFLLDSEDTEKFIKAVSDLQRAHVTSGFPSSALPRVGIIGGGAIALSCELDLGKILQSNLEVIPITPEKRFRLPDSLLSAQRRMKHQFVPGYVSDIVLWDDKNATKSVDITRFPGAKCSISALAFSFIFIMKSYQSENGVGPPARHAMETVTKVPRRGGS